LEDLSIEGLVGPADRDHFEAPGSEGMGTHKTFISIA
jgi:hypothetical protein